MPLLSTLVAIASIAAAGTTTGLSIDSALNQPGTPKTPTATGPTPAQQTATNTANKAAITQQLPQEEGLTSGFANPGYYAQQGASAAGVPASSNTALSAVESAFGFPPGSLAGGGGGGGAPTSAVQKFTPAGSGDTQKGAFPNGPVDLSDFVNSFVST